MRYRFVSARQTLRSPQTIIIWAHTFTDTTRHKTDTHTLNGNEPKLFVQCGILCANLVSMHGTWVSVFVTPLAWSLWLMTTSPLHVHMCVCACVCTYEYRSALKDNIVRFVSVFHCFSYFQTNFCLFLHMWCANVSACWLLLLLRLLNGHVFRIFDIIRFTCGIRSFRGIFFAFEWISLDACLVLAQLFWFPF